MKAPAPLKLSSGALFGVPLADATPLVRAFPSPNEVKHLAMTELAWKSTQQINVKIRRVLERAQGLGLDQHILHCLHKSLLLALGERQPRTRLSQRQLIGLDVRKLNHVEPPCSHPSEHRF